MILQRNALPSLFDSTRDCPPPARQRRPLRRYIVRRAHAHAPRPSSSPSPPEPARPQPRPAGPETRPPSPRRDSPPPPPWSRAPLPLPHGPARGCVERRARRVHGGCAWRLRACLRRQKQKGAALEGYCLSGGRGGRLEDPGLLQANVPCEGGRAGRTQVVQRLPGLPRRHDAHGHHRGPGARLGTQRRRPKQARRVAVLGGRALLLRGVQRGSS